MKRIIIISTLLVLISIIFSSNTHQALQTAVTNYYYFQGQKFYYDVKKDMVFIRYKENVQENSVREMFFKYSEINSNPKIKYNNSNFYLLNTSKSENDYNELITKLNKEEIIESAGYTYIPLNYDDGKSFYGISNEFVVQLKNNISPEQFDNLKRENNAEIIQQFDLTGGLTYLMKLNKEASMNAVDISNNWYEKGYVNYAEPNLYCTNMLCDTTNDQYFWYQWAIRNLGTNVPTNPPGVIADCDMDVDSAWMVSKGDSTIRIAVIDTGVDTNHADIRPNLLLHLGYDFADNDPYPHDQGNHGTSCAGISAGVGNNTIGTAGVAYKCKIIPIRAIGGISAYHGYANSFIHAKNNGADVITNSWGQTGGASSLLFNAISDAARYGRNGKGCLIPVASGNENGTMRFPAIVHPDIIVVGGLAPCNKRKSPTDGCSGETWGASYGSNLDLVAPCVKIYAPTVGGGYTSSFNGTSSATPNAAGVCALLLSANPNLRRTEAESYLYLTCERVGTYLYDSIRTYGTWNQEMGYGAINARLALQLMLSGIDKTPPEIYHDVLIRSSSDTLARQVRAIIKDNKKLGTTTNAPRLYYRVGSGTFSFVNAFSVAGDTFKFNIPGQITGSVVEYYFAAQDTVSPPNMATLPVGGSGVNPPGTTAPATRYSYTVNKIRYSCSSTTPKLCPNTTTIYDTINVPSLGAVYIIDVNVILNVSHRTDSDVDIFLLKGASQSELTTDNGSSGDSYVNTVFDDEAAIMITSGTAPFTGSYRPETVLSTFDGQVPDGNWILSMYDDAAGDFGTLDSWCIEITYQNVIGITETKKFPSKFELSQNYPNPFNPVTKIKYQIAKNSQVKLEIFDIIGRSVQVLVNEIQTPDFYTAEWDAGNYASGIYYYRLTANDFTDIKKMVLIK